MLIRLADHFPMRVTEWLLSGVLFSWGVSVLNAPAFVWDMPINNALAKFGSQDQWGCFAVCIGLTRMLALFINGAVRKSPHARTIGAFLSCLVWSQLTLAMFAAPWIAVSAAVYPWLFMAEVYNVSRAARDARLSDNTARQAGRRAVPDAAGA